MQSRLRFLLAPLTAGLAASFAWSVASAAAAMLEQNHLGHGFFNTVLFDVELSLLRTALPLCVVVAIVAAGTALVERRFGSGWRLLELLLPAALGLSFFLRVGYQTNRFRFSGMWFHTTRKLGGVNVPEALYHRDVWLANALIVIGAAALGLGSWRLMRWLGGERPLRLWRALGRPAFAALALAAVAGPLVAADGRRSQISGRPNFILISLDTLRADHLGAYGYERPTSPELDRIAGESYLFEWAISQAPNTTLSHMSTFTSAYPTVHGFLGEGDRLSGVWLTLAEYLRELGYHTAAATDGGRMRGWYGYAQGFERYEDQNLRGLETTSAMVLEWLENGLESSPFFVFLHTYDIHTPYDPPPPYRDMFADPDYDGGFYPGSQELEAIRLRLGAHPDETHGLSPEDVSWIEARYDEGIRYTDHVMGLFVERLRERGLLDDTWLIITSDHGEEFTEHGSVLHEKLYHTVTHVPLIIRPPGGLSPGERIPQIVELIDIMPTIMKLAGARPRSRLQGQSLDPLFAGKSEHWKNLAFSEHPWYGRRRAITTPSRHVITSLDNGEVETYDYRLDPDEQHRISNEPKAVPTAGDDPLTLLRWWNEQQARIASAHGRRTEPLRLDKKAEDELRALGYIP